VLESSAIRPTDVASTMGGSEFLLRPTIRPYSPGLFLDQSTSISTDLGLLFGGITAGGIINRNWGSSSFHVGGDAWTAAPGGGTRIDRMGRAYSSYFLADYFTSRIARESDDPQGAALTGALLSLGMQTYAEVLDGFSKDRGFSWDDMTMNAAGAGLSFLRSAIPGLDRTVDLRVESQLTGGFGDGPGTFDSTGQKYFVALKLSGFTAFEDTPLRLLELHAGYFAQGYSETEQRLNQPHRRDPYFGIGLNLQELLDWGIDPDHPSGLGGGSVSPFATLIGGRD
jgi:hypothetical protein